MEKTLASVAVAAVLVLSAAVSWAGQNGTTPNKNAAEREVASDFSKDYLEQVKDERADSLSDQKKAEENRKYVQKTMRER